MLLGRLGLWFFLVTAFASALVVESNDERETDLEFCEEAADFQVGEYEAPEYYEPDAQYEVNEEDEEIPSHLFGSDFRQTALNVVQNKLNLNNDQLKLVSGYEDGDTTYAWFVQAHNNISFSNAVANLALQEGKIAAFGSSFVNIETIASGSPTIQPESVIDIAEAVYRGGYNGNPIKTQYFAKPDGSVALVHVVPVENLKEFTAFDVFVDAHSGEILGALDFVSHGGYQIVPFEKKSIGEKGGYKYVLNGQIKAASPANWHKRSTTSRAHRSTAGNNVISYIGDEARDSNTAPETNKVLLFRDKFNRRKSPFTGKNPNAAMVNAFYIVNRAHDLAYIYGFKEPQRNFQYNNFRRRGRGCDPIHISVQTTSGKGIVHSRFITKADGQPGIMLLGVNNRPKPGPARDAAMDNTIILHEVGHGIAKRLTGGGRARCLSNKVGKAVGEGYADTFANWVSQARGKKASDFRVGAYWIKKRKGLRRWPYSTNKKINRLVLSDANRDLRAKSAHDAGEIWANVLHNVYAAFVKKYGYNKNAFRNPKSKAGNARFMRLYIEALKKQTCNPDFLQARQAWFAADRAINKKRNHCLLWHAFASRGFGWKAVAKPKYADCFLAPPQCRGKKWDEPEAEDLEYTNSTSSAFDDEGSEDVEDESELTDWAQLAENQTEESAEESLDSDSNSCSRDDEDMFDF